MEAAIQEEQLSRGKSSMQKKSLHVSASQWSNEHLKALRVVYLDDLPVTRFFDREHFPGRWDLGDLSRSIFGSIVKQIQTLINCLSIYD